MKNGGKTKKVIKLVRFGTNHKSLEKRNIESDALNNELIIQREWFRVTLSSIGDAVIATDMNSNVSFMNPVAEALTGFKISEAIGRPIREVFQIFNEHTLEPAEIPVDRVIKEGFVIGLANHTGLISKTGMKHSIADSAAPILDGSGGIIGVVMVFRDITDTKRLEDEIVRLDKLKLVGQLAAGIAHEIRNPMTTVRGFLQLLMSREEYVKDKEYFDLMIDELDRANSIIKGFLSLAKNNSPNKQNQNINSIVSSVSPLIQADAIALDKYVVVELGEIAEDLYLDSNDIRQLILNLARNGIEAMPPKSSLLIKTFMEDNKVVLSFQDHGEGIPPEILEKINTPFFTTKENGTGLGLSICYSIAEQYNATIDVISDHTGTTFFVRFAIA